MYNGKERAAGLHEVLGTKPEIPDPCTPRTCTGAGYMRKVEMIPTLGGRTEYPHRTKVPCPTCEAKKEADRNKVVPFSRGYRVAAE